MTDKEKDELKELDDIQNNLFVDISKPFIKFGRIEFYFFPEYKFKKPYRLFKILPDFGFIIDSQFKDGLPNMKGSMEYTIFFDWLVWTTNLVITIENKEITYKEEND
jgi:hypothetical protein